MKSVFLYGEDTYAARAAIGELAAESEAEIQWLDADDFRERRLDDVLGQGVGLFGRRLSVVRDPSRLPKDIQEQVAVRAAGEEGLVLLWERGMPDKRSVVWRKLKQAGREFVVLSERELGMWLVAAAKEHGGELLPAAAGELVTRAGMDRWRLMSELERLLLLGAPITVEVVRAEVAAAPETEVFALLDAVSQGNARAAGQRLTELLAGGATELYILSMLAYQFRTLLMIQAGVAERIGERELPRAAKIHPYVVQKNTPLARRLSMGAVKNVLARILATDTAIKNGTVDARTGIIMLVFGLARQVRLAC